MISIKELSAKTNETKASIHHYVMLQLLPLPLKTARNMAWYSPECIERIQLIRELQARKLSLSNIKELFDTQGLNSLKELVLSTQSMDKLVQSLLSGQHSPISAKELMEKSGIRAEELDELGKVGLIKTDLHDCSDRISADLVVAIAKMRRGGMSEELGFKITDLMFYRDAMDWLVDEEIRYFDSKVLGKVPKEQVGSLLQIAIKGGEEVVSLLRRRAILEMLDTINSKTRRDDITAKPPRRRMSLQDYQ
jgi:DNA-binding transcriptional MerR regulator